MTKTLLDVEFSGVEGLWKVVVRSTRSGRPRLVALQVRQKWGIIYTHVHRYRPGQAVYIKYESRRWIAHPGIDPHTSRVCIWCHEVEYVEEDLQPKGPKAPLGRTVIRFVDGHEFEAPLPEELARQIGSF